MIQPVPLQALEPNRLDPMLRALEKVHSLAGFASDEPVPLLLMKVAPHHSLATLTAHSDGFGLFPYIWPGSFGTSFTLTMWRAGAFGGRVAIDSGSRAFKAL